MKINELNPNRPRILNVVNKYFNTKIPHYNDRDAVKELNDALEKLGWTFMRGGHFSNVYVHPRKKYVIKINKMQDLGFAAFVKLVHQHPDQPHFPRISYKKTVEVKGKIHEIYLIEKLSHLLFNQGIDGFDTNSIRRL